jgi:hypothetical protein
VLVLPLSAAAQGHNAATTETFDNIADPWMGQGGSRFVLEAAHPVIGGVATSGGIGAGLGYNSPKDTGWFQEWQGHGDLPALLVARRRGGRRSSSKRAQIGAFGAVRIWEGSATTASAQTRLGIDTAVSVCAKPRSARVDGFARFRPYGWAQPLGIYA